MSWIYRFDRKFGRKFGLSNLITYVLATMLAVFFLTLVMPQLLQWLMLLPGLVLRGQVWRLITFIFIPLNYDPLRLALYLLCYYFIGRALEDAWGKCLFTLYYLIGIVGAIAASFVAGLGSNYYLNLSLLLAYAYLFPNNQFMLFFVIPFKAKWLGFVYLAIIGYNLFVGSGAERIWILFSLLNVILFFGPDVWRRARSNMRTAKNRRNYRKQWNNNPWA